jgi:hypothetical protein
MQLQSWCISSFLISEQATVPAKDFERAELGAIFFFFFFVAPPKKSAQELAINPSLHHTPHANSKPKLPHHNNPIRVPGLSSTTVVVIVVVDWGVDGCCCGGVADA